MLGESQIMIQIAILLLFVVVIPLLFIWEIAFKKHANITSWILSVVVVILAMVLIWATGPWHIVSIYLRNIFPLLCLVACFVGYQRIIKSLHSKNRSAQKSKIVLPIGLIVFFAVLNVIVFRGYYTYKEAVDLASPLRNKSYYIVHGGASPLLNHHLTVKPQNYALDIVRIGRLGTRTVSLMGGSTLEDYAIYGDYVYSPCTGEIAVVVEEFDDLTPPNTDTKNIAGNHILINCNGVEVILAHLKKGSIRVKVGDFVTPDNILAQVGNSGNTSEPHLHIHVESGGEPNTILNGAAVPFTINSRFLVRGSKLNEKY